MTGITVEPIGDGVYLVTVEESGSTTTHEVTDHLGLRPDLDGERVIEASFRFLLDREPKETILGGFDLEVIPRYFPEYKARLDDYL